MILGSGLGLESELGAKADGLSFIVDRDGENQLAIARDFLGRDFGKGLYGLVLGCPEVGKVLPGGVLVGNVILDEVEIISWHIKTLSAGKRARGTLVPSQKSAQ
jgi:hypothetical protein